MQAWRGAGAPFTPSGLKQVDLYLDEKMLAWPLHWKAPRRIFVCSQTDLFGEWWPDEWIDAVFGVMNAARHHTFQVLTKRPERMLAWFKRIDASPCAIPGMENECRVLTCFNAAEKHGAVDYSRWWGSTWSLPNVHLGVSVENQATADARIPLLLQTPAAVRWVSYEPALGPVDFTRISTPTVAWVDATRCGLDWVIVGGESGPGARPFDLAWARATIAQCRAAGVPVFVKQLGRDPIEQTPDGVRGFAVMLHDKKGGDWTEWPEDIRVREFPR